MSMISARFICSSPKLSSCPNDRLPEFAFIGRSNVGKSSLINMFTGRKGLAKVSSAPGKTRLINHFLIDESWYLVDLPGYGFARISKVERARIRKMIDSYLLKREEMQCVFLLLDSRLEPQKIDLDFISWMGEKRIPFIIIFTKTDKLSAREEEKNLQAYRRKLSETWEEIPPMISTSSKTRKGNEEVMKTITGILEGGN
jgi:GTP-binding protein